VNADVPGSFRMDNWRRLAVPAAFCVALSGCTTLGSESMVPGPIVSGPKERSANAVDDRNRGPERPQMRVETLPPPPVVPPSRNAAAQAAAEAGVRALAGSAPVEPSSLTLEQVPLASFAQVIYADVLKRNVNVDAQVLARRDLVTFKSGGVQSPEQLEAAAKLLLKSFGVAVIDAGGLVRIVPDGAGQGTLPEIRRGAALPETPIALRPVFHSVDLTAVQHTDVINWLRTMFGNRVSVQEDLARNALVLSGTSENVIAAMEAIRVLDQPMFRGAQSLSITPVYWSADELARRLFDVLTAEGYAVKPIGGGGGIRFPIVILPISGVNTIFAFAQSPTVAEHVANWARRLDKPNERGVGKNFFTYSVRHKDAAVLARTLDQLLSGLGRAAGTPAPTQQAAGAAGARAATGTGSVVVDASTNMLIFQTSQDEYSQIISLLQTLDRPVRAALIEVTVAELTLDDKQQLGIEWLTNQATSSGGRIISGTGGGLSIGSAGFNLRVFDSANALRFALNALASNNRATVLSSPRVLARNGESATIQVGQEVPIITSQQSTGGTTTGGAPQVLQTVQYRNTGVILKVKPVIHSGDQIDLDVSQEVSGAQQTNTGVNISPTFSTRKIDTKLTLRNGSTVMLGGLISDERSQGDAGIPLLKDVPGLGTLFKSQTGTGNRRELVVLITPYVINDDFEAESITNAFRRSLGPWAGTIPAVPAAPALPVAPSAPAAPAATVAPAAPATGADAGRQPSSPPAR
jgi:general secretion pathway protein D